MARQIIVDTSGMEAFTKQLQQLGEELKGKFLEDCTDEMAKAFLKDVTDNTPIGEYPNSNKSGGTLKGAWTAEKAQSSSGGTKIVVKNPMDYASYVEYGHRTRGGKGFVEGRKFMRNAEKRIKANAPAILQKRLDNKMREVLK